jgi:hypothetical protein
MRVSPAELGVYRLLINDDLAKAEKVFRRYIYLLSVFKRELIKIAQR